MLGTDHFCRAIVRRTAFHFCPVNVFRTVANVAAGAFVDDGVAHRFTAAHAIGFVNGGLERNGFATAHLFVSGDNKRRAHVNDALLQTLGREAAEHDRMRHADARAGLHGNHCLNRHRHVDDGAVTFFVTERLQAIGKTANTDVQVAVGNFSDLAIIGLEDDRGLVFGGCAEVTVEAVVGGV